MRCGDQIDEVLRFHSGYSAVERKKKILEIIDEVSLPDPERIVASYPHQLSGGQRQRIMIAMALVLEPALLIADEPTTALDVTIQAQILDLLLQLQRETAMALVLITHDLGVVAETADRVSVQYAGRQVESARADDLFADPHHPYTAALLAALPERATGSALAAIPGVVPGLWDRPPGCLFAPRCAHATGHCHRVAPAHAAPAWGHALCHTPLRHGVPQPLASHASMP